MKNNNNKAPLIIFSLLFITSPLTVAATAAQPFSFDQYRAQQAALNERLASIKQNQKTITTEQAPQSTAASTPTQNPIDAALQQLPLSGKINEGDIADLKLFLEKITRKHGNPATMAAMRSIMQSSNTIAATVAFIRTNRSRLDAIVDNTAVIKKLLEDPRAFFTQQRPASKPIIDRALGFLRSVKKFMSPSQWWAIMSEFVGGFFLKFWEGTWHLVQDALTTIIGPEKLYVLNADGSIKRDNHGGKLPRLYPQNSVNEEGEMERLMVPHKWFNILDDKQSILGQILVSGLDRSVASTFKSLDRLFFRPMVSTVLHIPRWKLSHFHYRLAMTEYKTNSSPIITPVKLGSYIIAQRNPAAFVVTGLPFSLRAIMMQKNDELRIRMLHTAITKHLFSIYTPLWKELDVAIKTGKGKSEIFGKDTLQTGTTNPQTMNTGSKIAQELGFIAKESLIAKTQDFPLAPYMAYANLALSIPQALFGFEMQGKPADTLLDSEGKPLNEETVRDIQKMIDICEAIARLERRKNIELDSQENKKETRKITIRHKDAKEQTTYIIKAAPSTIQKLLDAQERGLKYYEPFMGDLVHESYETYIMKLIMPRLVMKFIPTAVREKLGIENLADAAASMKLIQRHFKITFSTLEAMSAMMATIKQFEGATTFAGQYVRIADTFYHLLNSISNLIDTIHPTKEDPWFEKRLHSTIRTFKKPRSKEISRPTQRGTGMLSRMGNAISDWFIIKDPKLLSVTQRQQEKAAMEKSGHANPTLVMSESEIYTYLNATREAARETERKFENTTSSTVAFAVRLQKKDKTVVDLQGKNHITYLSFLKILNRWYTHLRAPEGNTLKDDDQSSNINKIAENARRTPESIKARAQEVALRAHRIILYTFGLLSLNTNANDEEFFTAGQRRNIQGTNKLSRDLKGFESKINSNLSRTLSHFKELVYVINRLYVEFGLREIIQALDAHYIATGQKMRDIPLKVFAKIAVSEGLAHLVGYGADTLLKKALRPIMQRITQLQETNMFGGFMLNQLANDKLSMFFGNTTPSGRSNAYYAAHNFVKNLFDYGVKTTLKGSNLMGSVISKFIPMGGDVGGVKEYQELALHAKMAAESGRAPNPIIAARLKKLGMDPAQMAAAMKAQEENEEDEFGPDAPPTAEEEEEEEEEISPAIKKLFAEAQKIGREKGPQAMKNFVNEHLGTLPQKDQDLLRKHGFGNE